MESCKTCKYWKEPAEYQSRYSRPLDVNTGKPLEMPFKVKLCDHPDLLFCERPLIPDGFAVAGSKYYAALYTAEKFGCVLHEDEGGFRRNKEPK